MLLPVVGGHVGVGGHVYFGGSWGAVGAGDDVLL